MLYKMNRFEYIAEALAIAGVASVLFDAMSDNKLENRRALRVAVAGAGLACAYTLCKKITVTNIQDALQTKEFAKKCEIAKILDENFDTGICIGAYGSHIVKEAIPVNTLVDIVSEYCDLVLDTTYISYLIREGFECGTYETLAHHADSIFKGDENIHVTYKSPGDRIFGIEMTFNVISDKEEGDIGTECDYHITTIWGIERITFTEEYDINVELYDGPISWGKMISIPSHFLMMPYDEDTITRLIDPINHLLGILFEDGHDIDDAKAGSEFVRRYRKNTPGVRLG